MTTITIDRAVVEQALEALVPWMDSDHTEQHAAYHALRAALAQQAEPVEPVAWMQPRTLDGYLRPDLGYETCSKSDYGAFPVYTAPPQRKPLTDQEIDRIRADCVLTPHEYRDRAYGWALHFARAVERAHGITDPQVADRLACHGIPMPDDENPSFG